MDAVRSSAKWSMFRDNYADSKYEHKRRTTGKDLFYKF